MASKAFLETRKKQFQEKMNDPEYLETSYERQNKVQQELRKIVDDPRKRVK